MSKTAFIDPLIEPLIKVMNSSNWIKTVSSCEGHEDKRPYIAFYCKADKINLLARILDNVEHEFFPGIIFDCCLVHDSEVHDHQGQAPPGWISLQLKFIFTGKDIVYHQTIKKIVFNSLIQQLNG